MNRRIAVCLMAPLTLSSLAACSSSHHSATVTQSTSVATTSNSPSGASPQYHDENGTTIGPPAAPVTYTTPADVPNVTHSAVAAGPGETTYTQAPQPREVNGNNVDSVASAFIATVNTFRGSDASMGEASLRASYLTTGAELSEIQQDGDENAHLDSTLWSQAQANKANASIHAKSVSINSPNTATQQNRCYQVTRVWQGGSMTETEQPFEECLILSKTPTGWLVNSDSIIPSGD